MKVYVDTSIVLRRMLGQAGAIQRWVEWDLAVTSELMRVEALRTLDRLRISGRLSDVELADLAALLRTLALSLEEIPIQSPVLQRASSPFPTSVATLDAIHLATALLWMEDNGDMLTFLTHDRQLSIAARACGMETKISR
jgi:predicted nucleic acid-binding protein